MHRSARVLIQMEPLYPPLHLTPDVVLGTKQIRIRHMSRGQSARVAHTVIGLVDPVAHRGLVPGRERLNECPEIFIPSGLEQRVLGWEDVYFRTRRVVQEIAVHKVRRAGLKGVGPPKFMVPIRRRVPAAEANRSCLEGDSYSGIKRCG